MKEIEKYAQENFVPIIEIEPALFIAQVLRDNEVKSFLEIGSAIGYSALFFAQHVEALKIDTIEKDEERYVLAKQNVARLGYDSQITCHFGDALCLPFEQLQYSLYDAIFIDAAKYRTMDFLVHFETLLKPNGIVIIDNLFLRGWVYRLDEVKTKRKRRLVRQSANFLKWLQEECDTYDVKIFEIGDGLAVCKRR